ncbi:MAG TPA: hypothetical protein PKD91_03460, partial [Bacteroidia bacterium]|nr:hypothetical protein [Bacteroidia bacterium]
PVMDSGLFTHDYFFLKRLIIISDIQSIDSIGSVVSYRQLNQFAGRIELLMQNYFSNRIS